MLDCVLHAYMKLATCHDHHTTNLAARCVHVQHVAMYYSAAGLHFSVFIYHSLCTCTARVILCRIIVRVVEKYKYTATTIH